jgi:hypothetical protein
LLGVEVWKVADILIRRDQFNITPQGIVHKPTGAAFTPYPTDPFSGTMRAGNLVLANGDKYRGDEVQRIMRELWVEYVTANADHFKPNTPSSARRRDLPVTANF